MKFRLIISLLICGIVCSSCFSKKLGIDRISYFSGNASLPPGYSYMNSVEIDSNAMMQQQQIGENSYNMRIDSFNKDVFNDLVGLTKKLPIKTKKFLFADGGPIKGITLFHKDSIIFTQTWQEQHKVSKTVIKMQNIIEKYMTPIPASPTKLNELQEDGEN
jgi:hypothetical protein